MARRYLRRKSRKYELLNFTYSNQVACKLNTPAYLTHTESSIAHNFLTVCPAGTYAGVRKVKNFVISIVTSPFSQNTQVIGRYMLFYLPQRNYGQDSEQFSHQSAGGDMVQLYEPNQNIIATGTFSDIQPVRVRTSLARNLMNGDRIGLMIHFNNYTQNASSTAPTSDTHTQFVINVQYALCYN